jgi:hypothetical protein
MQRVSKLGSIFSCGEPTKGTGGGMRENKVVRFWHQGMRGGGRKFAALMSSKTPSTLVWPY